MMNAKKLLAGALSIALLAGCSGGSTGGGGSAAPSGGGDKPADEEITVTVWGPQEDQSEDNKKWLQTQ